MGDGFDIQFNSLGILPFPASPTGWPGGFRLNPGAKLHVGGWFLELNVETGYYNEVESPAELDYYEQHGSHSLTPASPFLLINSIGGTPATPSRYHLGVRSFSTGWRFDNGIQLRIGPHYYEQTHFDNFFTNYGYAPGAEYAKTWIPLGWLNAEFRYDYRADRGIVREATIAAAVMGGADGTVMGISNGGLRLALGDSNNPPVLGLTTYLALRGNPPDPGRSDIVDHGNTLGVGGGAFMEYGIFSGGVGFSYQHAWSRGADFSTLADRSVATFLADFHPDQFRIRGALFLLNRADSGNLTLSPAVGVTETNTELTFGYRPLDWMEFTVGYRGAYGDGYGVHMGFIGLQTYLQRTVEFNPPPPR